MSTLDVGAARSRLAARESFFGGPVSTREQAKAPGWQAFVNKPPAEPAPGGKASKSGGGGARGGSKPGAPRQKQQAAPPQPNLEHERRQKIKQRRDFSGLDDDGAAPPPPPPRLGASGAARQQQTAAGPRQQQQQQQRERYRSVSPPPGGSQGRQKVTVKRAAGGGGGRMATAARGMALEVTAAGKGRKQMASDALKQRVGEMVANHSGRPAGTAGAAGVGSPTFSGTAAGAAGGGAAAARAAREAAAAKSVMTNKQYRTAAGMQTLQLVSRAPGQARGGAAGSAGGAGLAAMRAGAGAGAGGRPGMAPGSSPGSITKAQRPVTGAGAPRRLQQQHARAAGGGGRGKPQVRGSFYGGHQPPAALEARMQYNKRRLSMDSGGDLDSFIASDDDGEGYESDAGGGEEDWRAALKEATGGYDPSKYREIDKQGDRGMEAGYTQIQLEERRAARIARTEDEREAEAEALREAAKRERKRSRKTGVAAFVDDGSSD